MTTEQPSTLDYRRAEQGPGIGGIAWGVLTLVGLTVVGWGMWGVSLVLYYQMWRDYGAGLPLAAWKVDAALWMHGISGWLVLPGMAGGFALLLTWMYRSQRRVLRAGTTGMRFSPAGVVAGWFMPRGFLILPYEAMKALYTRARGVERQAFTPAVGTWWACRLLAFVMSLLVLLAGGKRESGETDAEFAASRAIWKLLPVPWFVAAGVLLMLLVWRVEKGIRTLEVRVRR